MKRKTSTTPTRIYTYGCLPPIEGLAQLDDQLRKAHRYRNKLVEIERRRRERIAQAQREHDVLGDLLEIEHSIETQVAEARREARLLRSGKGDPTAIAAQRELIEVALADLVMARFFLARARRMSKDDEELKAAYNVIGEAASAEIREIRNSDEAPYWGTYLVVEKAAEPWRKSVDSPRFFRYEGEGRVAVQLQKGATKSEIESGEDTRLRFCVATPRVNKAGRVQTAIRPEFKTVWIRIGSNNRAPVWAKLPFVMSRPLPDDAKVMWAWIIRRRVGVRYKYELQLTIEAESFASAAVARRASADETSQRTVAIDVGSRDLPTGETRVALWLDAAGESGEVKSPLTRLSSPTSRGVGRRKVVPDDMTKVRDLRAIRDKNLDAIKNAIAVYKVTAGASSVSPRPNPALDYLRERTERVTSWRSPARVAILMRNWERHAGDEDIHEAISAYLRQDRHLIDWESRERSRNLNRRRDRYRVFAARLTKTYNTIVLAKRDYRRAEWVPEQAAASRGSESREIMRNVAPGELCEEIKRAAKSRGVRVLEIKLDGDTAWAVDARVCQQLLASVEMANEQAPALANRKPHNHVDSVEPWKKRRLGTIERVDPLANEDVVR